MSEHTKKGNAARQFYEQILSTQTQSSSNAHCSSSNTTGRIRTIHQLPHRIKCYRKTIPFNHSQYFRAAINDNVSLLEAINFIGNDMNTTDQYGWSALMMASCEGSLHSVKFLLNEQVDTTISDVKGNTALSLATAKNHTQIVALLVAKMSHTIPPAEDKADIIASATIVEPFYCAQCKQSFNSASTKEHRSSTVHLFNEQNRFRHAQRYGIPDSNVGFKMMLAQGWNREDGLGPRHDGKLFPVKTTIRKGHTGLGCKQEPARITHFSAFDRSAIKWRHPDVRAKTRRDIEQDCRRNKQRERSLRNALS